MSQSLTFSTFVPIFYFFSNHLLENIYLGEILPILSKHILDSNAVKTSQENSQEPCLQCKLSGSRGQKKNWRDVKNANDNNNSEVTKDEVVLCFLQIGIHNSVAIYYFQF